VQIGLLAPPWIPVPPPAYGGIERIVALMARGLADSGHEVTLVAAPGTALEGVRVVTPLHELPAEIGDPLDEWQHALAGCEALADADVVVDHSGPLGALAAATCGPPALHVVHGPLEGEDGATYERLARRAPRLGLVAISHAQRRSAPGLRFAGVCHNGIDVDEVPFRPRDDGYLAFIGRMGPEKNAAGAIEVARRAGLPLLIAAKRREPDEEEYFDRHVAPHLGADIRWLGELDREAALELVAGARARCSSRSSGPSRSAW
jgi:glycosyltransferase involved in cell wall biosynthesis